MDLSSSKRICVIGAGPSGLAALKVISETSQCKAGLWSVVAFEARENIGGIWYAFSCELLIDFETFPPQVSYIT